MNLANRTYIHIDYRRSQFSLGVNQKSDYSRQYIWVIRLSLRLYPERGPEKVPPLIFSELILLSL